MALLLYSVNSVSQNYSPKKPGSTWSYKMADGSFTDIISKEKITHNQKQYFQSIRRYSWGTSDISYYRIGQDGTIYYLDAKSFKESIEVPGHPKLSYKWTSADSSWRYEIVNVNATLKTFEGTFKNCLVIEAEQIYNSDQEKLSKYLNYYSKDIGYVGSVVDGQVMAYLYEWNIK